jgi:hypothetical protein
MIGCLMLLPLAGLLLAGSAVTSTFTIAMGAVTSMFTIVMGMFIGSLIACSTAFMTFMILILS